MTLLTCSRPSLVAQPVQRLPAVRGPGFNPWVRKKPWKRKWHPTPVLLPGKSHGRRSLVGYSPWGRKESDTTERLHFTCSYPSQRKSTGPLASQVLVLGGRFPSHYERVWIRRLHPDGCHDEGVGRRVCLFRSRKNRLPNKAIGMSCTQSSPRHEL